MNDNLGFSPSAAPASPDQGVISVLTATPQKLETRPGRDRSSPARWIVAGSLVPLMLTSLLSGCSDEAAPEAPPETEFRNGIVVQSVEPIADTMVRTQSSITEAQHNANYGGDSAVSFSASHTHRLLVRFDAVEVNETVEGALQGATLRFHLESAIGFAQGQDVYLHRLVQPWEEMAATYECSAETSPNGMQTNCEGLTAWHLDDYGQGHPWVAQIAQTTLVDNDTVLEFDVTDEIAALLDGQIDHQGWIVALEHDVPGWAEVAMRESGSAPQLELSFDPNVVDPQWIPPEPEDVAPEPDLTVMDAPASRMKFLFEGQDPVQIDVTPNTIEDARVGVMRGRLLARSGIPLVGVEVRMIDHPELGMTKTRADGRFDIAANGGGTHHLEFTRDGLFDVRRRVSLPWNEFVDMGDITMIAPDPSVTVVDFDNFDPNDPIVTAGSSTVIDERGTRHAVAMFRENTVATMHVEGQSDQVLDVLSVRATEYTVGPEGPETMPGPLPRSSGYTFAVEFTIDEAEAAGASHVSFDPPVVSYVDNFIGFDVGTVVPAGAWDESSNSWIAEHDGLVIEVLGADQQDQDLAAVDIDGDGVADSEMDLADVGIDEDERMELLEQFDPGTQLWRVENPHFSAWDYNWGIKPPEDAETPEDLGCEDNQPEEDGLCESGSIIDCTNQALGESLPLAGSSLSLEYRSTRVPNGPSYRITAPLLGDSWPNSLNGIITWASVAGRKLTASYGENSFANGLSHEFEWDGLDAYGKPVQGPAPVDVCVSWLFPVEYTAIFAPGTSKFGYDGNGAVIGYLPQLQRTTLTRCYGRVPVGMGDTMNTISSPRKLLLGSFDAFVASDGLGGWTLSNHHTFAPQAGILYRGDGSQREVGSGIPLIETFAGSGNGADPHVGADRLATQLEQVDSIAVAADGDVYIGYDGRIVKVDSADGVVELVAGNGTEGFSGDGGAATAAQISTPSGMELSADGTLLFIDSDNMRIRAIDGDGIITTVAGDGSWVNDIDLLPEADPMTLEEYQATDLPLGGLSIKDLTIGPEGSIYYLARVGNSSYVRRVMPSGTVRHFTGYPSADNWAPDPPGFQSPGWGFATPSFRLFDFAWRLEADDAGEITVATGNELVRLGGSARKLSDNTATNSAATALALTPEGNVVFSNETYDKIYSLEGEVWKPLAGGGSDEWSDGIPAVNAEFTYAPGDLAFGPNGTLYIAYKDRVRRVYIDGPGRVADDQDIEVPSADGTEVYVFDADGRHLSTYDPVTGVTRWTFGYDVDGYLVTATDRDGDVTTIARDGQGNATSITTPDGVVTTLQITDGRLDTVTDAENHTYDLGYDDDGLMTSLLDPRGNLHEFHYDDDHKLFLDEQGGGSSKSLSVKGIEDGDEVQVTTAGGIENVYRNEKPGGDVERVLTHVHPDGTETTRAEYRDGHRVLTSPDGTTVTTYIAPDPRFGMTAPFTSQIDVTFPDSMTTVTDYQRRFQDGDDWVEQLDDDPTFMTPSELRYDTVSRTVTLTTAEGRVTTVDMDAKGRIIGIASAGVEPITIVRDAGGKIVEVSQGAGADERRVTMTRDITGFLDELTAHLGLSSSMTDLDHDAIGRTTSIEGPDLSVVSVDYDEEHRVTGLTPPARPAHEFDYNVAGLLEQYSPPLAHPQQAATPLAFQYDVDRRLQGITPAQGNVIDYIYAPFTHRVMQVSAGAASVELDHDTAGRVEAAIGPYGAMELTFGYDGPLLTSETWSGTIPASVSTTVDARGRIGSRSINGGSTVAFTYDGDNLLTQAGLSSITRDPASGRIDAVDVDLVGQQLSYNAFGETQASSYDHDGTPLFSYTLVHDQLGRLVSESHSVDGGPADVRTYEYNDAGRLSRVEQGTVWVEYDYDANGNRTSMTTAGGSTNATFDDQDRIETMGGAVFTSDDNGNVISVDHGAGDEWTYEFDVLGNLLSATLPGGGGDVVEYEVDARGRRVARTFDGVTTGILWSNQLDPIAQTDDQGVVTTRYVYGSRAHVPDYMVRGGATYRLVTDVRGSVRRVVDVATGTSHQDIEYGPWGEIMSDSNPGFQLFGYAGGVHDPVTGLVLFGARTYDPQSGRWLSRDPLLHRGGQANFYTYVDGDPANFIDETGLRRRFGDIVPWQLWSVRMGYTINSTVGLILGGAGLVSGGSVDVENGMLIFSGGALNFTEWGVFDSRAFTAGAVLVKRTDCPMADETNWQPVSSDPAMEWAFGDYDLPDNLGSPELANHEAAHALQARLFGLAYFPAVGVNYGVARLRGRTATTFLDDWANRWARFFD